MKLKDRKINEIFKTASYIKMQKLPITQTEKKLHKKYPNKVKRLDTKEILYLENNFITLCI